MSQTLLLNRSGRCLACLLVYLVGLTGCSSTRTTNTARTGREQMLVSESIEEVLSKVDFTPFNGTAVFVDEKYVDCTDKNYVLGSIRHHLLYSGATLVGKPEDAQVVLEVRNGAVGTDSADAFIGVPAITLPGMLTLPEVRLLTRSQQTGTAKLGIVAYDAKTHTALGGGGVSLAQSDDNNWYVLGIGPFQNGSVRKEYDDGLGRVPASSMLPLPKQIAFDGPPGHSLPANETGGGRLQLTGGDEESGP